MIIIKSRVLAALTFAGLLVACSSDTEDASGGSAPSSAAGKCVLAVANEAAVGNVLCACGSVGPGVNVKTEAADACTEQTLGRPALCFDHPQQGFCDCRAYICRTRVKDGRCTCGVGGYTSTGTDAYTEGCNATKGVCCVEGTSCQCGLDKCGAKTTPVPSCSAGDVLEMIAPKFEMAGAKRVASCSP